MANYGGATPILDGRTLTVEAPTTVNGTAISSTNPVEANDIFKIDKSTTASDSSLYKAVTCVAGDDMLDASVILVQALHRQTEVGPMGVRLLLPYSGEVVELPYKSGAAPTLGQSFEISDGGGSGDLQVIKGISAATGKGTILKLDTARLVAEVLL